MSQRSRVMQGVRMPDDTSPHLFNVGEYGRYEGEWYAMAPGNLLAGLAKHDVVENPDGSITVTPSILVGDHVIGHSIDGHQWHGYITDGVWEV